MSDRHDHSDMAGLEEFREPPTIVIPHLRRALRTLDTLLAERTAGR